MIRDWLSPFLGFNFISVAIPDNRQPVWALPPLHIGHTPASGQFRSVQVSSSIMRRWWCGCQCCLCGKPLKFVADCHEGSNTFRLFLDNGVQRLDCALPVVCTEKRRHSVSYVRLVWTEMTKHH